jgi:hypothetical protein
MKFNLFAAVIVTVFLSTAFGATDMCLPVGRNVVTPQGGHETWPWGLETPFPWRGIQGVWMAEIDGCSTYFTFKIVKNSDDEKILQIHEIEPGSCTVLSKGAGYEDNRVVMAVMKGNSGAFNVEVHSFRESDVREMKGDAYATPSGNKILTVMSVSPLVSTSAVQKGSYQLYKVSSDPDDVCGRQ